MKNSLSHENCIGCSENGMLIHGVEMLPENKGLKATMLMDKKREGWIGIPHGGIGMGAIMEMMSFHENYPTSPGNLFPLQVHFRMGGASARIGDTVMLRTWPKPGGAEGEISVNGAAQSYISASVSFQQDDKDLRQTFLEYMPASQGDMGKVKADMPNYKDCFVCGLRRQEPGLRRRFQVLNRHGHTLAMAPVGFNESDQEEFFWCRRGDFLHPLAKLALMDETMGWGGFLLSGHGGVSVRFSFVFLRDIRVNEKFIVFGRGEQMKGSISKRLMYWSSGGIAVVKNDGSLEMVAASSSQVLALPELTDQMRTHLFPSKLTKHIFQIAGSLPKTHMSLKMD
jgi:hypothetical protein